MNEQECVCVLLGWGGGGRKEENLKEWSQKLLADEYTPNVSQLHDYMVPNFETN